METHSVPAVFTAYRVHPDGAGETLTWPATDNNADQLRTAIDCRVFDCVAVRPDIDMWIDDEGFEVVPGNLPASLLVARLGGGPRQVYYGPVVFTGGPDVEGATMTLSPQALADLQAATPPMPGDPVDAPR